MAARWRASQCLRPIDWLDCCFVSDFSAPAVSMSLIVEDLTVATTLATDQVAGANQPPAGARFLDTAGLAVGLGVLMYLVLYRPVKKENEARQALFEKMKRGDEVVTAGGLVGTISSIPGDGKDVLIKVDGTRLRVRRDTIREIVPKSSKGSKDDKESESDS